MKIFKKLTVVMSLALALFGFSLIPAVNTHADSICNHLDSNSEAYKANGCGGSTTDLTEVLINIITGFVGILGIVAVIFVVVGGVNYMTSAGDAGKLKKAKDTILYAIIGLIISVLAFAIVNFVIRGIINNDGSGSSDSNTTNSSNVVDGGGPV